MLSSFRNGQQLSRHESYDSISSLNQVSKRNDATKNSHCRSTTTLSSKGTGSPSEHSFASKLAKVQSERGFSESFEAPAKLHTSQRPRSITTDFDTESLIQLEMQAHSYLGASFFKDLPDLVTKANIGFKNFNMKPRLADGAMGGTYFLRDKNSAIVIVCKPGDEEPNSPHNPYQTISHPSGWGGWYKGRIVPGFGMYREVAAFVLDQGFAGVPATQLARCKDFLLHKGDVTSSPTPVLGSTQADYKICSVQSYVRHECTAEDMGPAKFSLEDVQRIAAFDIRLCNLDRHEGNMLVSEHNPYRRYDLCSHSEDEGEGMFMCDNDSPRSHDSHAQGQFHLVPIDHGYVLPHVLYMTEPSLSWMQWPQSAEPITEPVLTHIKSLDYARDAEALRRVVGAALPETSLLTLQVCTSFLKKGAAAGLTLREMASAMCSSEEETPRRSRLSGSLASARASPLQRAVHIAIHRTVCACESCESSSRSEFRRTFNQLSHVMPRSNLLATKEPDVSNNNLSGASPTGVADLFAGDSSGVKTAQITQPQPLIRRLPSCSRCQDTSVPIKSSQVRVSEDSLTDALCIEEGARLALEIDLVMDQLATEILATR